jgi:hypothetical protein
LAQLRIGDLLAALIDEGRHLRVAPTIDLHQQLAAADNESGQK